MARSKDNLSPEIRDFVYTGLPEWLMPPKTHQGPPYTEHQIEHILNRLGDGVSYASLRREDPTLPSYRELLKFLRKNQHLYNEYLEAQQDGSEALVDMGLDLINGVESDGSPCMDDVPRLQARLGMIKWVAGARYAKRYGEKRQIDVNNKIDLTDALRLADERAQQHRIARGVTIEHGNED